MTATREKYSNNTLKDVYYDIILQRIIRDEYKSGDIITEKSLVDEFDVSKSPIREALISLCNEKLLKSIPHFGLVRELNSMGVKVTIIEQSEQRQRELAALLDDNVNVICGALQ